MLSVALPITMGTSGRTFGTSPPMVAMAVGKDDCEQRRIMFTQAGNLRDEGQVRFKRIERQAEIGNDAASRRLDLDAGTADLLGAPMDADAHLFAPEFDPEPECSL